MKREGSPLKGVMTIALKEAADHMTSARMHLIMLLVLLTAAGAVYAAIDQIRATTSEDPFLFLKLFTVARQPLPSFASFMGFLLPLVAIALGFDGVNGEFGRRTMSRILAQPIYRDAVLFGKFLGGMLVIGIALLTLWLLMIGLGILLLGLPPSAGDMARSLAYLAATLVYTGVWLALALAFSTLIKAPATSALAALSVWLIFSIFWSMITPFVANLISPVDPFNPISVRQRRSRPSRHSPASRRRRFTARWRKCCSIRLRARSGRCSCRRCRGRSSARRCRRCRASSSSGHRSPACSRRWCSCSPAPMSSSSARKSGLRDQA